MVDNGQITRILISLISSTRGNDFVQLSGLGSKLASKISWDRIPTDPGPSTLRSSVFWYPGFLTVRSGTVRPLEISWNQIHLSRYYIYIVRVQLVPCLTNSSTPLIDPAHQGPQGQGHGAWRSDRFTKPEQRYTFYYGAYRLHQWWFVWWFVCKWVI